MSDHTNTQLSEAPERLWIDARIITTPSMRVLYGEPPPAGVTSVEYVRADLVFRAVAAPQGDASTTDAIAWQIVHRYYPDDDELADAIRAALDVERNRPLTAAQEARVCIKCGHEERFSDNEAGRCEKIVGPPAFGEPFDAMCRCVCEFPATTPVTPSDAARKAAEEIAVVEKPNHSNEFIEMVHCDICAAYRERIAAIISRYFPAAVPVEEQNAAWSKWFDRLGDKASADVVNATADLVTDERLAALIQAGVLPRADSVGEEGK